MTGQQLMDRLAALTPEQLQLDVVVASEDALYGAMGVRIASEHLGEYDEDGTPTIVITSYH